MGKFVTSLASSALLCDVLPCTHCSSSCCGFDLRHVGYLVFWWFGLFFCVQFHNDLAHVHMPRMLESDCTVCLMCHVVQLIAWGGAL